GVPAILELVQGIREELSSATRSLELIPIMASAIKNKPTDRLVRNARAMLILYRPLNIFSQVEFALERSSSSLPCQRVASNKQAGANRFPLPCIRNQGRTRERVLLVVRSS